MFTGRIVIRADRLSLARRGIVNRRPTVGDVVRRFLAFAVVCGSGILLPNFSRAEFIFSTGADRQADLRQDESYMLGSVWDSVRSSSYTDDRPSRPNENPPAEEKPQFPPQDACPTAGDFDCGGTTTGSTAVGSGAVPAVLAAGCYTVTITSSSGRIAVCQVLIPQSPVPEGLLDPPRSVS
jgi:hypothetical protein